MIPADKALQRLRQGNETFRSGKCFHLEIETLLKLNSQKGQNHFAIILGCSDSRVPAEIIFGQEIGDLFVIRVAGNIVAPSQIASIEFAAENFGTRLVVVLGHSRCGAVQATLEQLDRPVTNSSPHLYSIVDRIRPAVENLPRSGSDEDLLTRAVRSNIEAAVNNLQLGSDILKDLVSEKDLMIVGAEYCLDTGLVDFFD